MRGFTLVEMLVAIGIIVFLTGLTLTAASAIVERADVQRTRDTMRLLDLAYHEWELAADDKVSWGPDERTADMTSGRAHVLLISELLDTISRAPRAKQLIGLIGDKYVYKYKRGELPPWIVHDYEARLELVPFQHRGSLTILDAWGSPIYPTHPGALVPPGTDAPDADGTERTDNENEYGVARDRRICFVSAGPDRRFGVEREFSLMSSRDKHDAIARAQLDNVYSYVPAPARAARELGKK